MRHSGSITGRHVAFAVLVLVVVNAQLTWWIIFATNQARDRLELERSLLSVRARLTAEGLDQPLLDAGARPPEGFEVVVGDASDPQRPFWPVAGDALGRGVRPTAEAWGSILDEYRRHIVMMVSEGAVFALLLLFFTGLMWRTFRREVELERQHRNFLSAITHEIKSPIAAIKVSLETVRSGRADEATARRFIGNALADVDRLEQLVQKVLQATRFGSRSGELERRTQSLSRVVESAVDAFGPRAQAAGARVSLVMANEIMVAVDDEAMAIVVSNLLENALKYGGDPAEIEVSLRLEGGRAVLEVADNGGGIAAEAVPHVFRRFYRAGDEMTRTSHGTGLGLYLVQQIVKAHHGRVEVADTGDSGTLMRVVLPAAEIEESSE